MSDPYQVLGLAPDAGEDEIATAYARERARVLAHYAAAEEIGERAADLDERLDALDAACDALAAARRDALTVTTSKQVAPVAASLEGGRVCPSCQFRNPERAVECLGCGKVLTLPCPRCRWPVAVGVLSCERCGAVIKEFYERPHLEASAIEQRTAEERERSRARVAHLESEHRSGARYGAVFWLVAFVLFWGVIGLAVLLVASGK